MLVKVYGASVRGLSAIPVTIEVNASRGIKFFLVGLPDNAVKESHERIVAAVENSGYRFPSKQFAVNKVGKVRRAKLYYLRALTGTKR